MHELHKVCTLSLVVATPCRLFCEAHTYQSKMATIQNDNTKSDDLKMCLIVALGWMARTSG